jgi:glycosyltransferase involved in cell wall biosynthesis
MSGRAADFAAALGGEAQNYFDLGIVRPAFVPVRYAISAIRTIAYLVRSRPQSIIVTSPPVFPGLIALAYCKISGAPLVLDTHPASLGLKGDRLTRLLMPVQAFVSRRAVLNMVTVPSLVGTIESWKGRALIVHEPPPRTAPTRPRGLPPRPRVLFVTIFASDEPVGTFMRAATLLGGVDLYVTGDLRKRPPEIAEIAPPNVIFTGFLDDEQYYEAIESANVVISLTMRAEAVSRVGYEAVYLLRPLVISDTPAARDAFPHATLVDGTPEGIAQGVRTVLQTYDGLGAGLEAARECQQKRWDAQLATLIDSFRNKDAKQRRAPWRPRPRRARGSGMRT